MLLDVVVQAPHVTVRKSLVSVDFIEVFLGEISLKNEFEKLPEVPATVDGNWQVLFYLFYFILFCPDQVMAITLSKVAVKTSYAVNKTAVIFNDPLVAEFAAKINVRRLIIADPTKATVPMIEVRKNHLSLSITLSSGDWWQHTTSASSILQPPSLLFAWLCRRSLDPNRVAPKGGRGQHARSRGTDLCDHSNDGRCD